MRNDDLFHARQQRVRPRLIRAYLAIAGWVLLLGICIMFWWLAEDQIIRHYETAERNAALNKLLLLAILLTFGLAIFLRIARIARGLRRTRLSREQFGGLIKRARMGP